MRSLSAFLTAVLAMMLACGGCGDKDGGPGGPSTPSGEVIVFNGVVEENSGGGRSEVFSVNQDGTDLRQLTHTSAEQVIQTMDTSPTEARIAYGLWRGGLWVIDGDGSNPHRICELDDVFDAQWSPDGSHILFLSVAGSGCEALVAADGSDLRVLQTPSNPPPWDHVSWSPLGDRLGLIIRTTTPTDPETVAVFNLADESLNALWTCPDRLMALDWSPIGDRILVAIERDTDAIIVSFRSDGSDLDTLVEVSGIGPRIYGMSWSPNGERIAFVSHEDYVDQLYIADSDGANLELLCSGDMSSSAPLWSADGQRIVFPLGGDNLDIYMIDASGQNLKQLTSRQYNCFRPHWLKGE